MAVNNASTNPARSTTAGQRRLVLGTNVAVATLLAVVVLVGINLIGHRKNVRKDLAGGFSTHRLSERSKRVLDSAPPDVRITTVYNSDDPGSNWREYLPPLQDYLQEVSQYRKPVSVAHIRSGDERAELRTRVETSYTAAAGRYKETVEQARATWSALKAFMEAQQGPMRQRLAEGSWLSGFTSLASLNDQLRKDLEEIATVEQEVRNLVGGEGIPRYQEANNKIKAANDKFKEHLQALRTWAEQMNKLVGTISQENSPFAQATAEQLKIMDGLRANLNNALGSGTEVPDDPIPLLRDYAKAANALSKWMADETTRVAGFVKQNPAIEQHPQWLVPVRMQMFQAEMPLHLVLESTAQTTGDTVSAVKSLIVQAPNRSKLELQNAVVSLRQNNQSVVGQMLDRYSKSLRAVLNEAKAIDQGSRDYLANAATGAMFNVPVPVVGAAPASQPAARSIIDQLADVSTKINELPKLELDEIAEKLKEDNIVVVEGTRGSGDKAEKMVRVLKFDEVWPAAAPDAAQMRKEEQGTLKRVFDGDAAISGAVAAIANNQPVATVILTVFESSPPPQMRQFQRPNTGPIPLDQLGDLRQRLERANFVVKDWNLAGGGEEGPAGGQVPPPPPAAEGTQPIYLFLPPASAPPMNPMMQQAPPPSFGEAQLKVVRDVLSGGNARGIFLAVADAMPRGSMFEPDPKPFYGYAEFLENVWGVDVKISHRVLRGIRDTQHPDRFSIDPIEWGYLPLSNFTDHPIGKPLKARRLLMAEACPVMVAASQPADVKVEPVLKAPETNDVWAESDIMRIMMVIREGRDDSTFTMSEKAIRPPFSIVQAAENTKTGAKIVVMGAGYSFVDGYLSRGVPRLQGKQARVAFSTDPPPTENVDLMLNAAYWLAGKPELIAAGPAPVPRITSVEPERKNVVWVLTAAWALAVLVLGGVMMFIRRK